MNESLKNELNEIRARQKVLLEALMALDQQLKKVTETLESEEKAQVEVAAPVPEPVPVMPPPLPLSWRESPSGGENIFTSGGTDSVPSAALPEPAAPEQEPMPVPLSFSAQVAMDDTEVVSPPISPESPEPVKEKESFEFRLGQVWLIRVAVLMFLTGIVFLGNMAYHSFIPKLSPMTKAFGLYVIAGGLTGLGLFLERWKESLKNYGQVILGGGLAAVYYTTYASHFVPQLRWIDSLAVAALLLFACATVITWMADWKKSQTLGTMGLLLAYYSCVINPVSWFTLLSNLLLGAAALVLLIRNRWSICSWLALPATYGAYSYWQFFKTGAEVSVEGFWMSAAFLSAYWLLFTGGIFLCRSGQCSDENKASFISLNNIAFYMLMVFSLPGSMHEPFLWMGTLGYGVLLCNLGVLACVKIKEGPVVCHVYITKGILFVTAGLCLKFSGYHLAMVLVLQSAVLLLAARNPFRLLLRGAAGLLAFVALVAGIEIFAEKGQPSVVAGLFVSLILLFQAWWEGTRYGGEAGARSRVYGAAFYYVVLAMIASLTVAVVNLPFLWKAPGLGLAALGLTWVGPRLRCPELSVGAQSFLWTGLGVWFWQRVDSVPPWWNMLVLLASALVLSFWWERQSKVLMDNALVQVGVFFAALCSMLMLYLRLEPAWNADQWMGFGGALAFVAMLYALVFRNWAVALFGQSFLVLAVGHFFGKTTARDVGWLLALVPLVSVLAMNLAFKTLQERKAGEVSGGWSLLVLEPAGLVYRLLSMFMALFWIHTYIPDIYLPGFLGLLGTLCVLWALKPMDWIRYGYGTLLIAIGLVFFWLDPVRGAVTRWTDLAVILAPAFLQQINRRWRPLEAKGRWQEILEILLSLGSLWIFIGNGIFRMVGGFYLTIGWSILALVFFGFGFLLKERVYRLSGLFILACTVGRIVFVDLWQFSPLIRILSLMVCGAVLGVLGFVYNRYAETIKKYL